MTPVAPPSNNAVACAFRQLAAALDQVPEDKANILLAKLALLLAEELGDASAFTRVLQLAQQSTENADGVLPGSGSAILH